MRRQTKPMYNAKSNFVYTREHDNVMELQLPGELRLSN